MKISLHCKGIALAREEHDQFERRLCFALGRFAPRVKHVAIKLADVNADRGGVDKRCRVIAHLNGLGQVVLEDGDSSVLTLMDRISSRLNRAIGRQLERQRFVRSRIPYGGSTIG